MDLDFESINNEGKASQPLIYPVIDVVKSMEEATTDGIHVRTLRDGTTNFSRPQADRALSNALKYGIFEMRKNQPKIADQLDDVDTIYWQAHTKHEETPYRLDNNCNYINPEKDRLRFRKFTVNDDENKISIRKVKTFHNEVKGLNRNTLPQKTARHCKVNKIYLRNKRQKAFDHRSKLNSAKQETLTKQKRILQPRRSDKEEGKKSLYTRKAQVNSGSIINTSKMRKSEKPIHKIFKEKCITTMRKKEFQSPSHKNNFLADSEYDYDNDNDDGDDDDDYDYELNYMDENENAYMYDWYDEEKESDFNELSDSEDYDDECKCQHFICVSHHLHKCTCNPHQTQYLKYFKKYSKNSVKKINNSAKKGKESVSKTCFTEHLKPTKSKYQNKPENESQCSAQDVSSNYSIYNIQVIKNDIGHLDKGDWLSNKLSNAQEKTIKQYDNTLKIEPLDSLSCKNLEKTSYIS